MLNPLKRLLILLSWLTLVAPALATASDGEEFPGRLKYPDVRVIDRQALKARYQDAVIVDTRSGLEFDTLRIKAARNIPVAGKTFVEQIRALRATTDKPIVFYCNGRSCMKSYRAARLCQTNGIRNTFAYDAGIFEWARAYPEQAVLLGKSPIRQRDIISKHKFRSHSLSPEDFSNRIYQHGSKSLVIDVRDKYQRGATGFFPGKERWASLDDREKLQQYIRQAKAENRALFIYDEVGKQVRWLQYALEKENLSNYYFMDKGAKGYFTQMMTEYGIR